MTNGWPKTDSDGLAPFSEGKIVAITNGNWAMGDYQKALGDNLAVAPLPAGPAGPATPLLGVDGYYINPNSQVKEAAIEVALYLTGAKAETEMMKAGHVPAITTVRCDQSIAQESLQDSLQEWLCPPTGYPTGPVLVQLLRNRSGL